MKNRAVFLDRDGTINIDLSYVYRVEDFVYKKNILWGLRSLQKKFLLVIVTNQSGIARGFYKEEDVERLHKWLIEDLNKKGVEIRKIYYCPHHPEAKVNKYKKECKCRKPKIGMYLRAQKEFNIDLDLSYMIGDRPSDFGICKKTLCKGFYVGDKDIKVSNVISVRTLNDAANMILKGIEND